MSTLPTRDPLLEERFPKLRNGGYSIKSPKEPGYNCVAFAVGNPTRYWQWMKYPTKGYYWPPGIEGDDTVDAWAKAFEIHGYSRCKDESVEVDTDKIAIYGDFDDTPTHVAKFDYTLGKWVSKLGRRGYDIEHDSHELLEGYDEDEYGRVTVFLKRKRPNRAED